MAVSYENGQYKKLGKYISEAQGAIAQLSSQFRIGNDYVGAIAADLDNRYPDVTLEWSGNLPELELSYMDICTLFFNLLKNAFEAAEEAEEKWVKVEIKLYEFDLFIHISNCYAVIQKDKNGEFQSTKKGEGHGYGMRNIKKCVEKNNGKYDFKLEKNTFHTEIILPNVIKNPN